MDLSCQSQGMCLSSCSSRHNGPSTSSSRCQACSQVLCCTPRRRTTSSMWAITPSSRLSTRPQLLVSHSFPLHYALALIVRPI